MKSLFDGEIVDLHFNQLRMRCALRASTSKFAFPWVWATENNRHNSYQSNRADPGRLFVTPGERHVIA